ncbi:potassium transporter TrkA [Kineosporia sp. A_224]|uniref:CASTOR/POLLUX-related putative ion channel n=1 Tax=Kineosporia sp. A_224 TaxID=1962180 RepID=UPI000B4BF8BC|nr:potassium transporter TrkA [Kineosporia sp. A_224]
MSWKDRLRYKFDNVMARGVVAQVLLLAVVTAALVVVGAAATFVLARPQDDAGSDDNVLQVMWLTLMHALDPGMIGGDGVTEWVYLLLMLAVTIGGIFVVSALIGVLNQGFGERLEDLRRGRSRVVEHGHTVILGWSTKIFPLLSELAEANRNVRGACVVVLADRDKVEMDSEIAAFLAATAEGTSLRVVTRRGEAQAVDDLALVALDRCKAVVVLAPERHPDGTATTPSEADAVVLKTLLALRKVTAGHAVHLVTEIVDERTAPVARMVVGDAAALVLTGPLVSRLLVQTGRQSGLSDVYGELLDFAGSEIYVTPEPRLAGVRFRDAVHRYGSSTLLGVVTADGTLMLPPDLDRPFAAGDQVVAISEDDDTVVLDGTPDVDEAAIAVVGPPRAPEAERTLVLGASPRLDLILRELDGFMAPGSAIVVVGEGRPDVALAGLAPQLAHATLDLRPGDVTDRSVLDGLDVGGFDHVIVLSETDGRSQDMADARTIVALLHLRDITRDAPVPVISEILDARNRDLASTGERDDFIVSNRLVSLVMSQIAENPHLAAVLDELMSKQGHELYVRPVTDYVTPGEVTFGTVCEAALRRGEIAIGYRSVGRNGQEDGLAAIVNPAKGTRLTFTADDKVVVLAEA